MNIPREAVKIISGFSDEVAMAVTHPLWPSKEPRKRSDSDIFVGKRVLGRRQTWSEGSHGHINSHRHLTIQYLAIPLDKQYITSSLRLPFPVYKRHVDPLLPDILHNSRFWYILQSSSLRALSRSCYVLLRDIVTV